MNVHHNFFLHWPQRFTCVITTWLNILIWQFTVFKGFTMKKKKQLSPFTWHEWVMVKVATNRHSLSGNTPPQNKKAKTRTKATAIRSCEHYKYRTHTQANIIKVAVTRTHTHCTCTESFWLSLGGNRTTFSAAPSSGCNEGMKWFTKRFLKEQLYIR